MINFLKKLGLEQITNGINQNNIDYIENGLYNLNTNAKMSLEEIKNYIGSAKYGEMKKMLKDYYVYAIERNDTDWIWDIVKQIIQE